MSTLRKCLHLLFQLLLVLCLVNYRYLAWKEYLLLFMIAVATAVSYSSYGRIMLVRGRRWGLSILHLLFLIALLFMTAVPVANGPRLSEWGSFPPPLGLLITALIFAGGLFVTLLGFVNKDSQSGQEGQQADENTGEIGEFLVAILLTLIVVGAITVGIEWFFLPGNIRGARLDSRFVVIMADSLLLLFIASRLFSDSGEPKPRGLSGRLVVLDYRPLFLIVLVVLSGWGFYASGRVLLSEWEAGKAYGAKDMPKAEAALRTVEKYNSVLRFGALERRTLERLGELYLGTGRHEEAAACFKKMLSLDPSDTLAAVKMIQIEASRGDFKKASAVFETSDRLPRDLKAINRLDGLLDCCPAYIEGQYKLGLLFLKHGMHNKAAEKFAAVIKYAPTHVQALERYAEILEKQGKPPAAAEARGRMEFQADGWLGRGGGVLKPFSEDSVGVELVPGQWKVVFEVVTNVPESAKPRMKVRLDDTSAAEIPIGSTSPGTLEATLRATRWGDYTVHFLLELATPVVPPADGRQYSAAVKNVRLKWAGK